MIINVMGTNLLPDVKRKEREECCSNRYLHDYGL